MAAKASQNISLYHDRVASSFQLSVSIWVPVMAIVSGFLARQGVFDRNIYTGDVVYIALSAAYIITSVLFLRARARNKLSPNIIFFSLTAYNIITLLFTLLLTGFVNVFLVAWVPLMVSTDLYFGRVGFMFSFLCLALSGIFTAVMYPNLNDPMYLIILTQEILGVSVMAAIVAAIRRIAENEGRTLVRVSEQEVLQRERLASLINSMTDAVVSTDERGAITVYNASFLALLDTNADPSGKQIDDLLQLKDPNQNGVSIIEEARSVRKVFSRTDVTHTFSDGEVARLYINVAPIRTGFQSISEHGFIFILRDITKEKTLEEQQDEFISVVSHELRTPVAIAEGNLSNIDVLHRQGAKPEVIDKVINDAHDHVLYLAKIINDLSTLSRAEQGIDAGVEEVKLKELLVQLYDEFRTRVEEKGIKLELDLPHQMPAVHTSREYIHEILENFLTNAIKYTTEGSITIGASQSGTDWQLWIRDTGIGIGKSDQPHIFEKFYRSEDYRTRESSGTGLGLYISARLAQKLGYILSFDSQINQGSTFRLTLKGVKAQK